MKANVQSNHFDNNEFSKVDTNAISLTIFSWTYVVIFSLDTSINYFSIIYCLCFNGKKKITLVYPCGILVSWSGYHDHLEKRTWWWSVNRKSGFVEEAWFSAMCQLLWQYVKTNILSATLFFQEILINKQEKEFSVKITGQTWRYIPNHLLT